MSEVIQETNRWKRIWIWLWYNDWFRIFMVMIPSYFVVLIPILLWSNLDGESIRNILCLVYVGVFGWAMIDNDYSNLRRIGLDEYRKKI